MKTEERLNTSFFIGFLTAMAGICIISFSGSGVQLHPAGDLLAVAAAFVWACYSILTRHISSFGHRTILTTRRVFAYGIFFMLPALAVSGFHPDASRLRQPAVLLPMLFLGLGASALCFVTWNLAVRALGAVKTSIYIYLVPVITIAASVLILNEPFTGRTAAGTLLTLLGLTVSEQKISCSTIRMKRRLK